MLKRKEFSLVWLGLLGIHIYDNTQVDSSDKLLQYFIFNTAVHIGFETFVLNTHVVNW